MAKYTVTAAEKTGEKPGKFGQMQTIALSLLDANDTVHETEWFTSVKAQVPTVGDQIEGEITQGNYGPQFKKPRPGGDGGGGDGFMRRKHPDEERQIHRQHSQEMALRHEANLVAAGNPPFTMEQVQQQTDWFEADVSSGKKTIPISWDPMKTDVPGDRTDLKAPPAARQAEESPFPPGDTSDLIGGP